MNIAIVDEQGFTREQVYNLIKRRKPACQVEVFATGEELLAAGHGFDLVFLDMHKEQEFIQVYEQVVEEAARHKERTQDTILIRAKSKGFAINRSDIIYIENRGKKVEIHMADDGVPIEIYATMEELTHKLGEDFYRCHRGYLVNMGHITEYDSDTISLDGGAKVYLSKKKHGEFVKAYMQFLRNGGGCCM